MNAFTVTEISSASWVSERAVCTTWKIHFKSLTKCQNSFRQNQNFVSFQIVTWSIRERLYGLLSFNTSAHNSGSRLRTKYLQGREHSRWYPVDSIKINDICIIKNLKLNLTLLLIWIANFRCRRWSILDRNALVRRQDRPNADLVFHNTYPQLYFRRTGFLCNKRKLHAMRKLPC